MLQVYDDQRIRFEYPKGWELEVTEDGPRSTVAVNAPSGLAFAFVTLDEEPDAELKEIAEEALNALREEYPELRAYPAEDTIDGHVAIGHDVEFVSLDMINGCVIRCIKTPRRVIMFFAQWSEIENEGDHEAELAAVRRSLEEIDA